MEDFISLSILPVSAGILVLGLYDRYYIYALLGCLLVNVAVDFIKRGVVLLFPSEEWLRRPQGARNCSSLNRGGVVDGAPGFPSGHVATAAFLVTAITCNSYNPIVGILGGAWVAAVAWSRLQKRCHNTEQVVAGGICGAAAAAALWMVLEKMETLN